MMHDPELKGDRECCRRSYHRVNRCWLAQPARDALLRQRLGRCGEQGYTSQCGRGISSAPGGGDT